MVQWSTQSAGLRIPSISAIIAKKKIRVNAGADSVRTGLRGRALIRLCACAVTHSMIVHYTTKFRRKPIGYDNICLDVMWRMGRGRGWWNARLCRAPARSVDQRRMSGRYTEFVLNGPTRIMTVAGSLVLSPELTAKVNESIPLYPFIGV